MAGKGIKSKDTSAEPWSIASKSSNDTKSKATTSPHSSKAPKGKLGAAEKQKLEEENFAREQERLRRATPDEYGVCLDDYSELLSCPPEHLSDTCAKVFGYSNSGQDHKNTFWDHLYVRALFDFRQFAQEEETLKRLTDIFLALLRVFSRNFLNIFEVLDVMGSGYAVLLQPPTTLSNAAMQEIMTFFLETYVYNFNLYRYVLTTEVKPIYKVAKITVRLPNADPFSSTTLCSLGEAIPQKEEKLPPSSIPFLSNPANDKLRNTATDLLQQAGKIAMSGAVAAEVARTGPSDLDVRFIIERMAKVKFVAFQKEVEDAVKIREKILAEKVKK